MDENFKNLQGQIFPKYAKNPNAVTTPTAQSTIQPSEAPKKHHYLRNLLITLVIVVVLSVAFLAALPSFV